MRVTRHFSKQATSVHVFMNNYLWTVISKLLPQIDLFALLTFVSRIEVKWPFIYFEHLDLFSSSLHIIKYIFNCPTKNTGNSKYFLLKRSFYNHISLFIFKNCAYPFDYLGMSQEKLCLNLSGPWKRTLNTHLASVLKSWIILWFF